MDFLCLVRKGNESSGKGDITGTQHPSSPSPRAMHCPHAETGFAWCCLFSPCRGERVSLRRALKIKTQVQVPLTKFIVTSTCVVSSLPEKHMCVSCFLEGNHSVGDVTGVSDMCHAMPKRAQCLEEGAVFLIRLSSVLQDCPASTPPTCPPPLLTCLA